MSDPKAKKKSTRRPKKKAAKRKPAKRKAPRKKPQTKAAEKMKFFALDSRNPIPSEVEELFIFLPSFGDTSDALDRGVRLYGVSGRNPKDDISKLKMPLLDWMLKAGVTNQESYEMLTEEDGEQHGYYIQFWGPWNARRSGSGSRSNPPARQLKRRLV